MCGDRWGRLSAGESFERVASQKIWGMKMGLDREGTERDSWEAGMGHQLWFWSSRGLILGGKVLVLNTLFLSNFIFGDSDVLEHI